VRRTRSRPCIVAESQHPSRVVLTTIGLLPLAWRHLRLLGRGSALLQQVDLELARLDTDQQHRAAG
jgi:hypothetical protein